MLRLLFLCVIGLMLPILSIAQTTDINCPGAAPPSRIERGQRARIIAEGGINVRAMPNPNADLMNIVATGNVVNVIDGPTCAFGYAWYRITYQGILGWTAEGVGEFYWLEPWVIQSAQLGTIRLEAQPELVEDITAQRQDEQVIFTLVLRNTNNFFPAPTVIVVDGESLQLQDAYPRMARIKRLDLLQGSGERYLTVYKENDESQPRIEYVFDGITDAGQRVRAFVPLFSSVAIEPLDLEQFTEDAEYRADYILTMSERIEAADASAFSPPLELLDSTLQSLDVNAPILSSDLLTFEYQNLTIRYNPLLASDFTVEIVRADNMPRHLVLQPIDYPVTTAPATIHIYAADEIDSTWLTRLQLLLSQQPPQPERIPTLPRNDDAQLAQRDVLYGRFGSGVGVRSIVSFEDSAYYSYQGLTDDRAFYISVLLPIRITGASVTPSLDLLDGLLAELTIVPTQ